MIETLLKFDYILKTILDCDEYAVPSDAETYSDIIWYQDTKKCSESEFNVAKAEYDAQEYARDRATEYPAIGDQLDDLYHKGAFSAEMTATLKKVKDDNPK